MATLFNNLTNTLANIRPADTEERSALSRELRLVLRLPHGWPESGKIEWCLYEGKDISAHGSVEQLGDLPADVRGALTHVWSPAEDTLLTQVVLPTRSRSKIAKALPFALEERLVGDPGEQFFTFESSADTALSVSITRRSKLKEWLAKFDDAGLTVQSISPITLSIPTLANTWVLHCERGDGWLRTGLRSGFRCEVTPDHPPYILNSALRDASARPDSLIVHNPPAGFDPEEWGRALGLEILVEESSFWEAAVFDRLPLNLMQQEFTPRRQIAGSRRKYLPAVYLLSAWLIGTALFTTYEWWRLDSEYEALRSEMTLIFRKSFPQEASLIVDPYKQMQANLAKHSVTGSGDSDASFLSLLGAIGPVLGRSSTLTLKEISYQANKLTASVELPDYRSLEAVKDSIADSGLTYTVRQVHQKEGKVVASIVLER